MWFRLVVLMLAAAVAPGELEAQSTISGRVVTDDGQPLAGAAVRFTRIDGGDPITRVTLTDAEGRFRIELPPGRYRYEVSVTGFAAVRGEVSVAPAATQVLAITVSGTAPVPNLTPSAYFNLYDVNFFSFGWSGSQRGRPIEENANQVKFRVAVRYKVIDWTGCAKCVSGVYAAYSQTSFWHLYDDSAPFFDNNYSPGVIAYLAPLGDEEGSRPAVFGGVFHESNGRDAPQSRGWNRWVGGVTMGALNRSPVSGSVTFWRAWGVEPTNPDLLDYAGRGEIDLYVQPYADDEDGGPFSLHLRSRILGKQAFTNLEANLLWQVPGRAGELFIPAVFGQLFTGYAENLLTYDERRTVLRLGVGVLR